MKRKRSSLKLGPEKIILATLISIATYYSVQELLLEFLNYN